MFRYYITSLVLLSVIIITWNISEFWGIFAFLTEDFRNIFNSTLMTFSISFVSALLLLAVSIFFSWLIYRYPSWEKILRAVVCISVIPSVLALIVLKNVFGVFPGAKTWNFSVIVFVLAFLNLIFLFVFTRLNRQLQEEFTKPYHAMTAQLAKISVFKSSFGKIMVIVRESFKSMMILTFSATVFLEARLSGDELYKGIYSYFFQGFGDTHVSRKLAILLFILFFLMVVMGLYSLAWRLFYKHYSEN